MPKGYLVARVSVLDPEAFKAYAEAAGAAIKHHGAKALARGGRCEIVEGEGRMRNVVLEFESFEKAKAYYYSPEYQAAMKKRLGIAVGDFIIVEGVE